MDSVRDVDVQKISIDSKSYEIDSVATESPLSVNLELRDEIFSVGVLMRTPGDDVDLVIGFLFGEGIITGIDQVINLEMDEDCCNIELSQDSQFNPIEHVRKTSISSSCGLCGRDSISNLFHIEGKQINTSSNYSLETIIQSVRMLRSSQNIFSLTGGSHAAGFIDSDGNLRLIAEDVGRHNAVDKLVGKCLSEGIENPKEGFLVVSGRASFELVLKSIRFGFPLMVAVGAPSSLAIGMAMEHGMTLVGFVKDDKISVYSSPGRVSIS